MSLFRLLATTALVTFPYCATAQETAQTQLLWGDTHLHTALSFDAFAFGTFGRPDLAYRYAKGMPVKHPVLGTTTRIDQPLDFMVIADHAEILGTVAKIVSGEAPEMASSKSGKWIVETGGDLSAEELAAVYDGLNRVGSGTPNDTGLTPLDLVQDLHGENIRPAWFENIDAAEAHNDPGTFTALIGWEWTSQPGAANLHRVVFMPNGGDVARQFLPYSLFESEDPEDLWVWLEQQEQATGAEFQAIPHGPSISTGLMYGRTRMNGQPVDAAYAEAKMRYEFNVEATQIKGDSETHPSLSPDDQFADFETFNFLSTPDGVRDGFPAGNYVRSGLRTGLELEAELGINPYKSGAAGGTDSHVGIPMVTEANFGGKSGHDVRPEQRPGPSGIGSSIGWDMGAAGFTGVWAAENTRRSIFDAFKRKEIYASTGPRISLRFFGGFGLEPRHAEATGFAKNGYANGVPMGGDLTGGDTPPSFTVAAMRDPMGANLDRVQIIKGWLNADGTSSEMVYDVTLSGGRTDGAMPVGNTVDLETGLYSNDIGEAELRGYWQDPDSDPSQSAFYYARAIEIPTPRYSLLDAIALQIDPAETGKPATIQERAYTSPIWFTPG